MNTNIASISLINFTDLLEKLHRLFGGEASEERRGVGQGC